MASSKHRHSLTAALLTCILLYTVLPVSAHPGKTDSNGGHRDSYTGDYHYHHGYPAHAHIDLNGDGIIDCVYDFDDQTGVNSGISSGGSFSSDGRYGGYDDGYDDGYDGGYKDGYDDGYDIGYNDGVEAGEWNVKCEYESMLEVEQLSFERNSEKLKNRYSAFTFICVLIALWLSNRHFQSKFQKIKTSCDAQIKQQRMYHDLKIKELEEDHATDTEMLNKIIASYRRKNTLLRISSGEDPSIILPHGITLKQSFTPIKGGPSKDYPYGEYTVFISPTGRHYHCKCDCNPNARVSHYLDLSADIKPCSRCVPSDMYPQPLPEWYTKIHDRINREHEAILKKQCPEVLSVVQLSIPEVTAGEATSIRKQSSNRLHL